MAEKSKTARAAELVEKKGMTVLQAALQVGISPASVHVYLKKKRAIAEGRCPCCGQKLPTTKVRP